MRNKDDSKKIYINLFSNLYSINSIGERLIKFNIVEPGTLPAEEKPETIKVYPDTIPLSANWIIIIMWRMKIQRLLSIKSIT